MNSTDAPLQKWGDYPAKPEVLTQAVVREPAAKPMAGIFGKKAEVTSEPEGENIPVAEERVYSTDADAIPDAPAEEAAKPAVKSIFSKAS